MALRIQHTTLGTTTLIERHWESQYDIAAFVLPSWHHSTFSPIRTYFRKGTDPASLVESSTTLGTIVNRLSGLIDPLCQESMVAVERITQQLCHKIQLPPALDIRRKRTMGRAGYAVNIHKVYRGQLATAWRRVEREHLPDASGVITLVLCTDFTANAIEAGAHYTTAATLALARKIEETGRRCEIWASILTHEAHRMRKHILPGHPTRFHELDHIVVKRAHEELAAPGLAALCSLSFLRNLFFHVWDLLDTTIGPMDNHGKATFKADVLRMLTPYVARQGIDQASVIMGADELDHIYNEAQAVAWCQHTINTLKATPSN